VSLLLKGLRARVHPIPVSAGQWFSGRPAQNTPIDGPPRKGTIAPWENHPSQGPKHPPPDFRVGGECDVGWTQGLAIPLQPSTQHHVAPPPPPPPANNH